MLAQTGYEVGFGPLLVARLSSEAVGQSVPSGTVLSDGLLLHLRPRVRREAALEAAARVRLLLPGAGD